MGRFSRAERIKIWQQRLDRYLVSNQTVADFCEAEGVSVPSFYQWKRRLLTPGRDSPASRQSTGGHRELETDQPASTQFTELVVTGHQAAAQAQLPNGVSISLGRDVAIAQAIVDRLIAYRPAEEIAESTSAKPTSASDSTRQLSC